MHQIPLKNKRIALTGGSGFVGSYLVESLINNNELCIIDNQYRGSNIEYLKKVHPKQFEKNVKLIKSDIRDKDKLLETLKIFKPDYVFHLAGIAGVSTVVKKPLEVIDVNLIGGYNLSTILPKIDSVKKLVYTSTSEVYGPTVFQLDEDSFTTQGTPYDPRWSYATSKLFAEHIFVAMEREYGIKIAIGRLFNIYGPRQIGSGAVHEFVKNAIRNKPLTIYDDGAQIRAWCYIDDCIVGLGIIAAKGNGIYNIGNPHDALTSVSLARKVIEISQSKSRLVYKKLNHSDVKIRIPNINKISKLGYRPSIRLEDGLVNTINWYKKADHWVSSQHAF